jgi:hypothetical protein
MDRKERSLLFRKASQLVEMLIQSKSGRISFKSEEQFLRMLRLEPVAVMQQVRVGK